MVKFERGKMRNMARHISGSQQDVDDKDKIFNKKTGNKNLDLNVLLNRHKQQKNKERKFNILIISAITAVSITVLLIFSL